MALYAFLKYLPAGWTENKYQHASDEDFTDIPEDQVENVLRRISAEAKVHHVDFVQKFNAERIVRGLPARQFDPTDDDDELHHLVKLVEDAGWDDFGFLVFRTHFDDDNLWDQFRDLWDAILQQGMDAAPAAAGLERIREKLCMKMVDDDALSGKSPKDVAFAYRLFEDEEGLDEDEILEPGLHTRMCLFVDEECMRSVTEPSSEVPPFVKAVDVTLGQSLLRSQKSFFKVAIKSLVLGFYASLLLPEIQDVTRLYPTSENKIWEHLSQSLHGEDEWRKLKKTMGY
ncbi:hypothetical protein E4T49_03543 [Aureobasidium sp. EXF-10728]|nr:hypothetical protein E4T49_03543 [Aureobasidium sp. EXF-10728]